MCIRDSIHTGWLDSEASAEFTTRPAIPDHAVEEAARLWGWLACEPSEDPFGAADSWRMGGPPARVHLQFTDDDGELRDYAFGRGDYEESDHLIVADALGVSIAWEGQPWTLRVPDPMRGTAAPISTDANVLSPMPGTILEIKVAAGDHVMAGETLGMVEAMKMELALKSPYDGVVSRVGAAAGDQVPLGHVVFTVDPPGAE